MHRSLSSIVLALSMLIFAGSDAAAAAFGGFDRAQTANAGVAAQRALDRAMADPGLARVARVSQVESRYALPTFLWATGTDAATATAARGAGSRAAAARAHLDRVAPFYRLDRDDVREATLRRVHDTGRGGVIATFAQEIDGVEVFRDAMSVMMDRDERLVAVSGYLPRRALLPAGSARGFRMTATEAVARALEDLTGVAVAPGLVRHDGAAPGGYQRFGLAAPVADFVPSQPIRAKRVWFHLPESLQPAHYVELLGQGGWAYVIAAADGEVLFRHDLVVSDAFAYRVWADASGARIPWGEGPPGVNATPHPTGVPDLYTAPFVPPVLVSLQNGPISTNDPWLPAGATVTTGNNVDAYADIAGGDGYDAGLDVRPTTTSPNTFDRVYDTSLEPTSSNAQRMAAVTQLFYTNNFLHDWFYDSGFDEAAGNAQASNYGRGGVEGDRLLAEGQDFSGVNNANMLTPSDGGAPRMQMYRFNRPIGHVNVTAPAAIAGQKVAGVTGNSFGPATFSISGTVAMVVDGIAPTGDACSAVGGSVAGKIALIDRAACGFVTPVKNAQNAGAIAAIVVDDFDYGAPFSMGGADPAITIPVLSVTLDVGNAIKAHLGSGVTVTMTRATSVSRDGTIDNMIIAHEWGHYISNRLVGNGGGLSTNQAGGMGEGFGDFHALLLTVREGDNYAGAYPMGPYALTNSTGPMDAYYFGIRRYPYSTDFGKDPLTFRHIQAGVPLPVGPPVAFTATGVGNNAVHRTGEVWCTMLWECYAALLNDSGRLTFAQAQQRMRDYLVAGYKMTPNAPTFTEARDAILAAAAANDPADLAAFWAAFARRGIGTGAQSPPDRYTTTNAPVVESYAVGADVAVIEVALEETAQNCDADGYLDNHEVGALTVTIRNTGAAPLASTTATVSSTHPGISFPQGNTVALAGTGPFTTATATINVQLTGASGASVLDFEVEVDDPALLVPGPRTATLSVYGHADEEMSATHEGFETVTNVWTYTGAAGPSVGFTRLSAGPGDGRLHGYGPGFSSDAAAMSPPLAIAGPGSFRISFDHAYRLEDTFDGGVLEISTNDGATWTDLGPSITSGGYTDVIVPGSAISGRSAWSGISPGYPALTPVVVDLGTTYHGQTVRVRFRVVTDGGVGDAGWSIASLVVEQNNVQVFPVLIGESAACTPVAVDGGTAPGEIAFALASANPVRGAARFRLALPAAARVDAAVYDIGGRRVAELARGTYGAGEHALAWEPGAKSAGVYFARVTAGGRHFVSRVVMIP